MCFPVRKYLLQSPVSKAPLHQANQMSINKNLCKFLEIITDTVILNHQARSIKLMGKLDLSRTEINYMRLNELNTILMTFFVWNITNFYFFSETKESFHPKLILTHNNFVNCIFVSRLKHLSFLSTWTLQNLETLGFPAAYPRE